MKILQLICSMCLVVWLSGCNSVSESQQKLLSDSLAAIDAGVLPPNQMRRVLLGLHIAEAKVQTLHFSTDSTLLLTLAYKQRIFDQLKIDTAYYRKSYGFYANNPFIYDRLYESINDSLNMRQTHNNIRF